MCIGEDAIKVWIRGLLASFNASAALSISLKVALARPVMAGPLYILGNCFDCFKITM